MTHYISQRIMLANLTVGPPGSTLCTIEKSQLPMTSSCGEPMSYSRDFLYNITYFLRTKEERDWLPCVPEIYGRIVVIVKSAGVREEEEIEAICDRVRDEVWYKIRQKWYPPPRELHLRLDELIMTNVKRALKGDFGPMN
jgi:hypothetical protein